MLLEHHVDGLQVEFGGHVAHRQIFVVAARGVRAFIVADHQMLEHLPMADEVRPQVHGHEAGQLQEAGINFPPRTRIDHRHGGDDVLLEPAMRRCVASVLTAVGAFRVSTGPPIMVSVLGRAGCLSAFMIAVAA